MIRIDPTTGSTWKYLEVLKKFLVIPNIDLNSSSQKILNKDMSSSSDDNCDYHKYKPLPFVDDKDAVDQYKRKSLFALLQNAKRRMAKTHLCTHMDMKFRQSYHIEDNDEFFIRYISDKKPKHLLERTMYNTPVMVDVDLNIPVEEYKDGQKLYTHDEINTLAKIFMKVIRKYSSDVDVSCYVLEKPGYIKDDKYKNGYHLHFPHVWLSKSDFGRVHDEVQKQTDIQLDRAVITGNWFLYGSGKDETSGVYKVTKIIEEHRQTKCYLNTAELVLLLSVRVMSNDAKLISLPHESPPKKKYEKLNNDDELENLVDEIDDEYADETKSWLAIGKAIFNSCVNENYGHEIFQDFSSKSPLKYDYDNVERFWQGFKFNSGKYSLATLYYYKKQSLDDSEDDEKPKERLLRSKLEKVRPKRLLSKGIAITFEQQRLKKEKEEREKLEAKKAAEKAEKKADREWKKERLELITEFALDYVQNFSNDDDNYSDDDD